MYLIIDIYGSLVSRLEGFVSNKEQSYEDPIEVVTLTDEDDSSLNSMGSTNMSTDGDATQLGDLLGTKNYRSHSSDSWVAFVVDTNITSYLMMGSTSPGLTSHAVTLYEARIVGHDSLADLCGVPTNATVVEVCDKIGRLALNNNAFASLVVDFSLIDKLEHSDTSEVGKDAYECINSRMPQEGSLSAKPVAKFVGDDITSKSNLNGQNDEKLIPSQGSDSGKGTLRRKKKYRVDILRYESLVALPKATLKRLFLRDHGIVVSMVFLPYSSILPRLTGPIHFGPPSPLSMTPWMKLVLYSTVAGGPLSVVLMKGQCLHILPAPLAGCEKTFIWTWDSSTIEGLGGKLEGNLVKGRILLRCLNSLLKCFALIVQPLNRYDLDESGRIVTMDITLPLKNSDGSINHIGIELGLCLAECSKLNFLLIDLANKIELWIVRYICVLKLFKERESDHFTPDEEKYEWVPLGVEFGMPLFNLKLCNNIVVGLSHHNYFKQIPLLYIRIQCVMFAQSIKQQVLLQNFFTKKSNQGTYHDIL
ncbi:hypothetical protein SLEP1_g42127 [Rubroshorea leprosula]|uniref:FAM91 C-terminal domain-containing protein n=1 Tax=Rubroshorea leprosula TaxID=152421 RepID=A0AAV5L929_9ROSI|nr:hypothetical protein SLEP1_g42127 [Rubroshorea leprosula]